MDVPTQQPKQNLSQFFKNHISALALAAVCALALFFLVWRLPTIPYGLNNDAAWEGSAALDILRGRWQPYLPYAEEGWRGEGIVRALVAVLMTFLGPDAIAIRISTMLFGLGFIPVFFLFLKRLFGTATAFTASCFAVTSGWFIVMSRSGWRAMAVPLLTTATLYAAHRALESRKMRWYALSGALLSFGSLYTYDAARIFPLIFLLAVVAVWLRTPGFILAQWRGILVGVTFAIAVATPMVLWAAVHWHSFIGRADFLFIGNAIARVGSWEPLWENIRTSALLFTHRGNGNDFFIYEPLLDAPVSWLFVCGMLLALWQIIRRADGRYQFMVGWLYVVLIPGLLSVPNGNRAIGAMPAVYTLAAIGMVGIIRCIKRILPAARVQHLSAGILLAVCAWTVGVGWHKYLGPHRRELKGFYPETLVVADYLKKAIQETHDIYIDSSFPHETLTLLLYAGGDPFVRPYTWAWDRTEFLNTARRPGRGLAYVTAPESQGAEILERLHRRYPDATFLTLQYRNGPMPRLAAHVLLVPPDESLGSIPTNQ